jgi:hypothetical protein
LNEEEVLSLSVKIEKEERTQSAKNIYEDI